MSRVWLSLLLGMAFGTGLPAIAVADESSEKAMALVKTLVAEFVAITPGEGKFPATSSLGTAQPADGELALHEVRLPRPFAMAKYEVPQNLYEAVMGQNPSRWKGPRNSVEMMSFTDATSFCEKVTRLARDAKLIAADEVIRLPTEGEWEYCCRAGTTTVYSFGDDAQGPQDVGKRAGLLNPYGWHAGNAAGNDPPVGALKPNPWGLYDMHGYLWELTQDRWSEELTDLPRDGSARPRASEKDPIVIRGGSWKDDYRHCRSASRRKFASDAIDDAVGFRCVRSKLSLEAK